MSAEITLQQPAAEAVSPLSVRLRTRLGHLTRGLAVIALLAAAWAVRTQAYYESNSDFAYWLGVVGGTLMLALLAYPLRKRVRGLSGLGALRHWFRFHMLAGLLGPLLVLFHSTFHVRSLNAAVALGSMLLVALSGIIGRFIYRHIHRGLYGRRATLDELKKALEQHRADLASRMAGLPETAREISQFADLVGVVPEGRWERMLHFLSLGLRRRLAGLRARRALARQGGRDTDADLAAMEELIRNVDLTLKAAQQAAQFSTYERLFSLWHAVHIPFLCMLVITALVHVLAVHAY
ncbi:MAG: hypothetical protein AB1899_11810 [Pseudomonadota bacterium]